MTPREEVLTVLQAQRVEHALIEKSRASFRLAGRPEAGLEVGERPLDLFEGAPLRETLSGWIGCREELISLLVGLGREYERCTFALQGLLREALIALLTDRGEPPLRGGEGLRTGCEACGEVFPVKRPKGVIREVWWSDHALQAPPKEVEFLLKGIAEQKGLVPLGRARFGVVWEPVPPGVAPHPSGQVRRVVTCPRCRRRRLGRCEHEAIHSGGWQRCGQLTTSSIYCEEHQEHRYRRARERDLRHRRVLPPSVVPPATSTVNLTSSAAVRSAPLHPGALGA